MASRRTRCYPTTIGCLMMMLPHPDHLMDIRSLSPRRLVNTTIHDLIRRKRFGKTKNLDGETNLKSRNAVSALTHLRSAANCASKRNTFRTDCRPPDVNMFRLDAAVRVGDEAFPADMQTTLLRGTVLRNTALVI